MLKYNFGIPQVNWSVVRLIMKTNKRSIKVTVGVIKVQYSKLYMTDNSPNTHCKVIHAGIKGKRELHT